MNETKRQWVIRIVTGGLSAALLLLALLYIWDAIPLMGGGLDFRSPAAVLGDWLRLYPGLLAANLLFAFLLGAETGVATLPFADSGRELVARSLAHFAVTAATVTGWARMYFNWNELPIFLALLVLIYALVWLGRWVGWYAEVAAIREKLGLAPGPSPLHWKETLPYLGFAFLLCVVLPALLRLFDPADVPVLTGVILPFLLLPVGGFCSGVSLGKRHGLCPLYPAACGVLCLPMVYVLYNTPAISHCVIVFCAALAGDLAGTAWRRGKQRRNGVQ